MNKRTKTQIDKNTGLCIGQSYMIRTVTHYFTGKLLKVFPDFLLLGTAAWIANTKRWTDTLATGDLDEVEPFPDAVWVSREAIIDITPWRHELPQKQL